MRFSPHQQVSDLRGIRTALDVVVQLLVELRESSDPEKGGA
jgi:hypothetical protein